MLLGALVSMFGNVTIRALSETSPQLTLTQPILPGVPFTVQWSGLEVADTGTPAAFYIRSASKEIWLSQALLSDGVVTSEVPCEIEAGAHQLLMKDTGSGEVLATATVEVLESGQDCAF